VGEGVGEVVGEAVGEGVVSILAKPETVTGLFC
jgi:hypothetical protein